ncbi:hypothetical protein ACFZAV_21535 [Streptomyces sp. NPDC008343]|uniref:hypothetical protein n=1 Tax=Streptomyces sp. NPDC008343 TaxID=3364828 RepID=UPI0036ECC578
MHPLKKAAATLTALTSIMVINFTPVASADTAGILNDCDPVNYADKDSSSYVNISVDQAVYRYGPYEKCREKGGLQREDGWKIDYHCFVVNSSGNKWTYARFIPPGTLPIEMGWIYGGNLPSGGSVQKC